MHASAREAEHVGDGEVGLVTTHVDAPQLIKQVGAIDGGILVLSTAQSVM